MRTGGEKREKATKKLTKRFEIEFNYLMAC